MLSHQHFALTLRQVTRLCIAAPKHGWYLWLYLLANLMTVEFGITISTDDLAGSDTRTAAFWALDQKMVRIKTTNNQMRSKESSDEEQRITKGQRPCGWNVKEQVCKYYLEVFQSGTLQSSCSHSWNGLKIHWNSENHHPKTSESWHIRERNW